MALTTSLRPAPILGTPTPGGCRLKVDSLSEPSLKIGDAHPVDVFRTSLCGSADAQNVPRIWL